MIKHSGGEIKVAQAAGQFSLLTHYAHGENSMGDTIVGLAQRFPGANNINLFEPVGQFGSILSSESSSHRYIYTHGSIYLRQYMHTGDDLILEHKYEDGDRVEPTHFYPVLPMWIVNGAQGIGTGHSVKILPRDPASVRDVVRTLVKGQTPSADTINTKLLPTFTGWDGTVTHIGENQYQLTGVLEKVNTTTIRVTALPVTYSVDRFKAILVQLMDDNKVKDFDNNSSESGFDFTITVPREVGKKGIPSLIHLFKLSIKVTENVTMWNTDGKIEKYESAYAALVQFVTYKLERVEHRRLEQIKKLEQTKGFLSSKLAFINRWNEFNNPGKIDDETIQNEMRKVGVSDEHFKRLIQMSISSLTLQRVTELQNQILDTKKEIKNLETVSYSTLYTEDLKRLKG
jgi:DNA topoisomerase-2